ncbi:MAG: hypothetical protein FD165_709 [Gammaproteobacteria bacterium]|nr:MAG: hypothetical protein FD165_709 [Gammaproteobacteria bacterium]TND07036.1 MAG: hypothetical protein FD120_204 [Gammaproteobacteria bacterium]
MWLYQNSRVGVLTLLLFAVYALPFIHVIPYLWFDFDATPPPVMWGLAVNPYMTDKSVIELMSMIGAVGATGFVFGALLGRVRRPTGMENNESISWGNTTKTLSLPVFLVWIVVSIALTWVSAPKETIFTAAYTQSEPININWGFSAAWMVSYAVLTFALADAMFEFRPGIGKLKRTVIMLTILLVVIWFQLLRGDRESLTFVVAAALMYYAWGRSIRGVVSGRRGLSGSKIFLVAVMVFAAAFFVGSLRSMLAGTSTISELSNNLEQIGKSGALPFDNMMAGTWSGVLLTPLSIAGDYINGSLAIQYGKTYLDLVGSIIPGFLADWIGYERPIDAFHGPAWEMTYGIGGTHAVVVPFLDFRMAGVFLIMAIWSYLFAKSEQIAIRRLTVANITLLGIVAMATPHWMWYGEKYIMNALILWIVLSVLYRIRMTKTEIRPDTVRPSPGSF